MRKLAQALIFLAWLIYICSMFLPVEKGELNGILTTLLSIYSIKTLPVMFFGIFNKDNRGLAIVLTLMGLYGLCNLCFISSGCALRSKSKFVMQTYRKTLIAACIVSCSSILWLWSGIGPADQREPYHLGIGIYVWPLAFLMLLLGAYQLERDKLLKNEFVDDQMKSTDNNAIEPDRE